ncbi:hypothetical protein J437_LFUL013297 [Ladona fulva]|uniref:Uncharacterized protein n=1 Tax=Ladona fulva TaxID=123851 RepID=A0A8K0P477_LADFU|nr:hypothetical protein J437_LFUL013297 [Ladona fulva]
MFISLALNNALWLVWYEEILDNPVVLSENGVSILSFEFLSLYLHTLLAVAFVSAEGKVILAILSAFGWLLPAILTALYAGLRASASMEETQQ